MSSVAIYVQSLCFFFIWKLANKFSIFNNQEIKYLRLPWQSQRISIFLWYVYLWWAVGMQIKITTVVICPIVTCTKHAWPKHINISQVIKRFNVSCFSFTTTDMLHICSHFYFTHLDIFLFPTSHHCRSYIPNPYGGRRACEYCSPGWAGQHTLCSTHNHQTPNSHQWGTWGARQDIYTQLGIWHQL